MVYTTIGTLFIILFGAEIGYNALWLGDGEGWLETEPLEGHPIRFNLSGHIIPVVNLFLLYRYNSIHIIFPTRLK